MATSYEKRHLPDILWFHKHGEGGGAAEPSGDFLLLQDDPGDGSSIVLLQSDAGAQIDGLLLQSST